MIQKTKNLFWFDFSEIFITKFFSIQNYHNYYEHIFTKFRATVDGNA